MQAQMRARRCVGSGWNGSRRGRRSEVLYCTVSVPVFLLGGGVVPGTNAGFDFFNYIKCRTVQTSVLYSALYISILYYSTEIIYF